jgi:hypothetical protein
MSARRRSAHHLAMKRFVLYHRHAAEDCGAAFAAWNGFQSPLRGTAAVSSCVFGAHEIWWDVTATDEREALAQVPGFVADRTVVVRVAAVDIV